MATNNPQSISRFSSSPSSYHTARRLTNNDNQGPPPRKIADYVVDPVKWQNPAADKVTTDTVLSHNIRDNMCGICGERGMACPGQPCVESFHARVSAYGEQATEIRSAGAMGQGVFATRDIPTGTWLGEYLGEIDPMSAGLTLPQYQYTFDVDQRYQVESLEFRNWTAFMNHGCDENVSALSYVYGRRYVIAFRANRPIAKGEQMFTWYGRSYFEFGDKQCLCDAVEGPHLPSE